MWYCRVLFWLFNCLPCWVPLNQLLCHTQQASLCAFCSLQDGGFLVDMCTHSPTDHEQPRCGACRTGTISRCGCGCVWLAVHVACTWYGGMQVVMAAAAGACVPDACCCWAQTCAPVLLTTGRRVACGLPTAAPFAAHAWAVRSAILSACSRVLQQWGGTGVASKVQESVLLVVAVCAKCVVAKAGHASLVAV